MFFANTKLRNLFTSLCNSLKKTAIKGLTVCIDMCVQTCAQNLLKNSIGSLSFCGQGKKFKELKSKDFLCMPREREREFNIHDVLSYLAYSASITLRC